MKKTILSFMFSSALLCSNLIFGQTEFRIMDGMQTRFNDVNDSGMGVTVMAYYDFANDQMIPMEAEALGLDAINNDGNVAGTIYFDQANGIAQSAYRIDGEWKGVGFLPDQTPGDDGYTTFDISPNNRYITGQTNIGFFYGGFIYDTQTETLTGVFDSEGESAALYTVNSEGIAGGWIDRPNAGGTSRVPAYRTADGEIHMIPQGQAPEESQINQISHITDTNVMVGDFELSPFIYDLDSDTFTSYELPNNYSGTFTKISDNGIAVGFADVAFQIRDAIIYHPSLGDQPVFIKDILADQGIEVDTMDGLLGTAISISPNGEYIVGWVNGPPMYAEGWILYLDDLFLGTEKTTFETISAYPNPVQGMLNINSKNVESIDVYTLTGQKVKSNKNSNQIDFSELSQGLYLVKISADNQTQTLKIVKE